MGLVVLKFGGSSVRTAAHMMRMAHTVHTVRADGNDVVVVLSAQGDMTERLLASAREITQAPAARELDALLAAGEQMSAAMGAMALASLGVEAVSLCGWQLPLLTDDVHTNALVTRVDTARLRQELNRGRVAVVAGFQGVDAAGDITTLGRGGSDTSAVALAAALQADALTIYTDVDGIYSVDPRLCPGAVRRARIGYDDMLLLARKGAQVLHDRSVALAKETGVTIEVKKSTGGEGSLVCADSESGAVVGVTQKAGEGSALAAITAVGAALPDAAREHIAAAALEREEIRVYAAATGERYLTLYVLRGDAPRALAIVHDALIVKGE